MTTLVTNRYGVLNPTAIQENGTAISVPFYICPTPDQTKQLLNAFRNVKQKQLIELGWEQSHKSIGTLSVETFTTPPITPIEQALGVNEDNLRHILFARQGIQERVLIKLMRLTGVYLITREQVEHTYKQWLDHLYGNEHAATSTASTITKQRKTKQTEDNKSLSLSST
jgi:hypothetical protein